MKIVIEEIISRNMFPGLILGDPTQNLYNQSLEDMIADLGTRLPIHNLSRLEFRKLTDKYGTWGHITGVKIRIVEGWDNYEFSMILNFYQELEQLEKVIRDSIDSIDWRNNSYKWDIGDL